MNPNQTLEVIQVESLLNKIRGLRERGYRLVQVSATRLPEQVEMTYSFDLDGTLVSLRLSVPAAAARLPSVSSIFGCVVLYENEIHDLFGVQITGIAVDYKGNFYRTSVPWPFNPGTTAKEGA